DTFEKERDALRAAFSLLIIQKRKKHAIDAMEAFIRHRKKRYLLLSGMSVPHPKVREGVSCEEAEAFLELREGVADYIGNGSMLLAGLMHPVQTLNYLQIPTTGEWFYRGGLGMLLLMYYMDSAQMDLIVNQIVSSTSWQGGIF